MTDRIVDAPPRAPILSVRGLRTVFGTPERPLVAVDNVSFDLAPGEILGIVGESGSGKSITLRSLIGIARPQAEITGQVFWRGRDLVAMSERELRVIRGREIAMIFQEPMSSLDPLMTIGGQITENLAAHTDLDAAGRKRRAIELLDLVGIPGATQRLGNYPHEFSGGMRQRVMIATALASNPALLLADEPTTALDVTIQDQILRLLSGLSRELGMSIILVTHDVGVVAQTCDRVAVMYAGRLCETGETRTVIRSPRHPYTRGLLASIPVDLPPRTPLSSIPGATPALSALPSGCAFAARCPLAEENCSRVQPALAPIAPSHLVACHRTDEAVSSFSRVSS